MLKIKFGNPSKKAIPKKIQIITPTKENNREQKNQNKKIPTNPTKLISLVDPSESVISP
jgi:hypothetical protein